MLVTVYAQQKKGFPIEVQWLRRGASFGMSFVRGFNINCVAYLFPIFAYYCTYSRALKENILLSIRENTRKIVLFKRMLISF